MARTLAQIFKGIHRLVTVSSLPTHLRHLQSPSVRTSFVRTVVALPSLSSYKARSFSLPNSSWSSEMMRLYEHYNSQCEVETEGGGKQEGSWQRLPSYTDLISGADPNKMFQSKGIFFTQNITEPGAAFEYVLFVNTEGQKSVCILQAGHLLEGPPGYVHGGAVAAMIDTMAATHSALLCGLVVTASLNINYRSPIPLGSTVLLESSVDKNEGRKTFISCKVTSSDGSQLHTDATALFLSVCGLMRA